MGVVVIIDDTQRREYASILIEHKLRHRLNADESQATLHIGRKRRGLHEENQIRPEGFQVLQGLKIMVLGEIQGAKLDKGASADFQRRTLRYKS